MNKKARGNSVRVVIYSSNDEELAEQVRRVVEGETSKVHVETCRGIEGLERSLLGGGGGPAVAVILVSSQEEFVTLHSIRDAFPHVPIILILPDRDGNKISMGHKLRPRFLTYADSDLTEVGAVLGKMWENISRQQDRQEGGYCYGERGSR